MSDLKFTKLRRLSERQRQNLYRDVGFEIEEAIEALEPDLAPDPTGFSRAALREKAEFLSRRTVRPAWKRAGFKSLADVMRYVGGPKARG